MEHKSDISYPGGLEQLAVDIGNLRYDSLEKLLKLLSTKIGEDAQADQKRGRKKLSKTLRITSNLLKVSALQIKEAWKISEPYMKQ